VLLLAAGCGGPTMAKVTGTVAIEPGGAPLKGGIVTLLPADDPTKPSAVGDVEQDGTFVVSTYKKGDGAEVGRYLVTVIPVQDDYNARNPRPIDARFGDPATSKLEFVVEPGKANVLTITVHPPRRGG
jgi:hypothetical protein